MINGNLKNEVKSNVKEIEMRSIRTYFKLLIILGHFPGITLYGLRRSIFKEAQKKNTTSIDLLIDWEKQGLLNNRDMERLKRIIQARF